MLENSKAYLAHLNVDVSFAQSSRNFSFVLKSIEIIPQTSVKLTKWSCLVEGSWKSWTSWDKSILFGT